MLFVRPQTCVANTPYLELALFYDAPIAHQSITLDFSWDVNLHE